MRLLAAAVASLTCVLVVEAGVPQQRPARGDAQVPFAAGETLTYDVSWSNMLTAGTAVTRVGRKRASFGATAWELSAEGQPLPLIQRLYPVHYKMDSLLDSATLLTQWTGLYMDENGRTRQTSMRFDRAARRVHFEMATPPNARADFAAPNGVQDGLALLYALRTRTFRAGERFTIPVADDGSLYTVDATTTGPESIRTRAGTMTAWTLALNIRNEQGAAVGRDISVSISTDARRLPVRMQAELPVGKFMLTLREIG